jgi:WD40-like Beta Propeller Repeat
MCSRRVRALLGACVNKDRALLACPDEGRGDRGNKWLILALVVCGLASACSQYNTNLTIQTSSSSIAFVSPSTAVAGGQTFTLTVNGAGFVTGAIILWNVGPGQVPTQLVTTIVNYSQLTAPVPASLVQKSGTVQIAVQIPGSAVAGTSSTGATTTTEISNVVYFSINSAPGPAPTVTSLSANTTSQASTPYCSAAGITLTVNGTNFVNSSTVNGQAVSGSTVYWNGQARPTTFVSALQLTATIPPTDTAFSGTAKVSVYNDPASSSPGTSNSLSFTLLTPTTALAAPGIPALSQTSAAVGSPAQSLTVTGSNILPCSVVQWVINGNAPATLPTTYIAPTSGAASFSVTLPATDLLAAGTAQIVVFTPGPGGGTSGGTPFAIVPPAITTVTGSSTAACSLSGLTLTVNGVNFSNSSVVDWNNSPRPTTFVSSTQLTAQISSTDIAFQVTEPITVKTGAAVSNSVNFSVAASAALPAPANVSLLPVNATAGTAAISMNVTGNNFLPCSLVQWNGTNLPTTFISTTQQLTAVVPATDILSIGSAQVTVFNPTTGGGGGASAAVAFPIVAPTVTSLSASTSTTSPSTAPSCGYSGLTLTVTGTNFVNGLVVNWNGSPRPTVFVSPTQLTATISAADTAFPGTASVTVSSSTVTSNSSTFTLAAPASLPVPAIASVTPSSAVAGNPAFLLETGGTGWAPCTLIEWNGSSRTTLFVGTTGATAAISAADIGSAGKISVTAVNPAPGGGTSNTYSFPIFSTPGQVASTASAAGSLAPLYTSADGRYSVSVLAAFVLTSTTPITEIPGSTENIYVQDSCTGVLTGCTATTNIVSVGLGSNPGDGNSISPSISADGRYVTFLSSATNLVANDTNNVADVFVRDTCAGVASVCTPSTQRVSIATSGIQALGESTSATINSDGRYITFRSAATNLDPASSATTGFFLRDTCAGATGCTPTTQELQ